MWYAMVTLLVIFALFGHLIYEKDLNGWKFELYLKSDLPRFRIPIVRVYGIFRRKQISSQHRKGL